MIGYLFLDSVTVWLIPAAALLVSVGTFFLSQVEMGRRAKVDYVDELEHRIEECEKDRVALRGEVKALRSENLDMMRRLVRLETP